MIERDTLAGLGSIPIRSGSNSVLSSDVLNTGITKDRPQNSVTRSFRAGSSSTTRPRSSSA